MKRIKQGLLLGAILLLPALSVARTIVLGFDGMDPGLADRWMSEGVMPNFRKLADSGYYQPLDTTNPAQSPVAWASFATGQNPGEHGIFDFIKRDVANYAPDFSISEIDEPDSHVDLFGYHVPLDDAVVRNRRVGKPFWVSAEQQGNPSSVLRVPVTYPPDRIHRMLAGMGVPDLLGSQGMFTFYASRYTDANSTGGRVVKIRPEDGRVISTFEGPPHPLKEGHEESLAIPLVMTERDGDKVEINLGDEQVELGAGEWSDWIPVSFSFAGAMSADGMVRLYLVSAFPRPNLYVSPINIDPRSPAITISAPEEYAAELASRIGPYHTLGMPEETWSLNERRIDDDAYLEMVKTVLGEREAMYYDTLERNDSELVVAVFVQTDRVSHMFWRGLDEEHPLHEETSEQGKGAIRWIYQQADRILGETLERMGPADRLIVLSDHGFTHFRRVVHLNRWLIDQGYLVLKPGNREAGTAFSGVDWSRTRAYALGLNGIFINQVGRESEGIVTVEQVAALKREISQRLIELSDEALGLSAVAEVYDGAEIYHGGEMANAPDLVIGYEKGFRASWQTVLGAAPPQLFDDNRDKWSGDHCIAPNQVPGVLFTSFKPTGPVASITDISKMVLEGVPGAEKGIHWENSPASGFFDLANPLFDLPHGLLSGWMPAFVELSIWGLLAAWVSMRLYRLFSNQEKLRTLQPQIRAARKELATYDGEFAGLWPLIGDNYRLAGKQLWLTFVPAFLSSLPLLFLLAWISNNFDVRTPGPGDRIEVTAQPYDEFYLPGMRWQGEGDVETLGRGEWLVSWPQPGQNLELVEHDGAVLLTLPYSARVGTIHEKLWWNSLFSNQLGYLPGAGAVEHIDIGLPAVDVLGFGPDWMRAWYFTFFVVLIGVSLWLKHRWRLV